MAKFFQKLLYAAYYAFICILIYGIYKAYMINYYSKAKDANTLPETTEEKLAFINSVCPKGKRLILSPNGTFECLGRVSNFNAGTCLKGTAYYKSGNLHCLIPTPVKVSVLISDNRVSSSFEVDQKVYTPESGGTCNKFNRCNININIRTNKTSAQFCQLTGQTVENLASISGIPFINYLDINSMYIDNQFHRSAYTHKISIDEKFMSNLKRKGNKLKLTSHLNCLFM